MKNVGIYYRVSTDKQDFESQKYALDRWVEKNQPESVTVFQDYALSGADPHRPQLKRMLDFAKKGKIDAVVTYRLDRLSRKAMDALEICLKLDRFGCDLICVKQNLFTTIDNPFRRTMITLFAELAELERGILIGRIRDGLAAAKARGVKLGPPKKLTEEKLALIHSLRDENKSLREISKVVGLSLGCISKALRHK